MEEDHGPRGIEKSIWLKKVLPEAVRFDLLDTVLVVYPTVVRSFLYFVIM